MPYTRSLPAMLAITLAVISVPADAKDGGPTGAFSYSNDARVAAVQRQAEGVVERYQTALNTGDFPTIRKLFAPDAMAEWNTKRTMIGPDAMASAYEELFRTTKFTTDFQYDAVDIHADGAIAIVRTHHPVGQTELNKRTGARTLDFNREIFVLARQPSGWQIILYTFSAQPRQGEQ